MEALSVVVIFYNMKREAERTLFSLTPGYQQIGDLPYEVIAVDNGSKERLSPHSVQAFGPQFSYSYSESRYPSPCSAINEWVAKCRFDNVMILIDGARMLSPGIVRFALAAGKAFAHPFVYTIAMHLGSERQNDAITHGYNAAAEDRLLESVPWKENGYSLFRIATPGFSSDRGFYSKIAESNCVVLRKKDFFRLGGYRVEFESAGGGLSNHDFFNRAHEAEWIQPILLLGEASFHQIHGGVATNVPVSQHPWERMEKEFTEVVGERWRNKFRAPLYLGSFREECAHLYQPSSPPATTSAA